MWPNLLFPTDMVILTEEILNRKLLFCAMSTGVFISKKSQNIDLRHKFILTKNRQTELNMLYFYDTPLSSYNANINVMLYYQNNFQRFLVFTLSFSQASYIISFYNFMSSYESYDMQWKYVSISPYLESSAAGL